VIEFFGSKFMTILIPVAIIRIIIVDGGIICCFLNPSFALNEAKQANPAHHMGG